MLKKRGEDEQVFLFAVKVVIPTAAFFATALVIDVRAMLRFIGSGPIDSVAYTVSNIVDAIF